MSLADEVAIIQQQGFQPCMNVSLHRNSDGSVCGCCVAANASFRSEIIAATSFSDDGIMGVLSFLQRKFQWGVERCHYLCEMMTKCRQIDCGCGMGLALLALEESFEHRRKTHDAFPPMKLVACQLIIKTDVANTRYFRGLLDNTDRITENHHWQWITDNLCYHQCVGFYSPTTRCLRIWDYDGWFQIDKDHQCEASGIVSIKVTPYQPKVLDVTLKDLQLSSVDEEPLLWDGITKIPMSQWVNILEVNNDIVVSDRNGQDNKKYLQEIASNMYPTIRSNVKSSIKECHSNGKSSINDKVMVSVTAFMSSCHMSSTPFPGIGVARSLRSWQLQAPLHNLVDENTFLGFIVQPKTMHIVGVDDMDSDPLCGLTDPCFDSTKDLMVLGQLRRSSSRWSNFNDLECTHLWNEVVEMMNSNNDGDDSFSFFIPCIDIDVYFLAARVAQERKRLANLTNITLSSAMSKEVEKKLQVACNGILCPPTEALVLTEKPTMSGGISTGLFKLPEYYILEPSSTLSSYDSMLLDAQSFCDRVGYPILVKGEQHGAQSCYTWTAVSIAVAPYMHVHNKSRCFLQKIVRGIEKTIAFAAVEGHLTGCVMMTKTVITSAGKVWAGMVSPVNGHVMMALENFVSSCKWNGGGELEFIESIEDGLLNDGVANGGQWYLIDFNPRFPAWISACCYTGCNLAADLIAHACLKRLHDRELEMGGNLHSNYLDVVTCNRNRYLTFPQVSFTKSVMEVPIANHMIGLQCPLFTERHGAYSASKSKSCQTLCAATAAKNDHHHHPSHSHHDQMREDCNGGMSIELTQMLSLVSKAMVSKSGGRNGKDTDDKDIVTPSYYLSTAMVKESLTRHQQFIANSIFEATKRGNTSNDNEMKFQMSLSVKTQPLQEVLIKAKEMNYFAECISMAEVRAAIKAGFGDNQIILTGPGKFWDKVEMEKLLEKDDEGNHCQCVTMPSGGTLMIDGKKVKEFTFAAIFADSLMDLYRIVQRINDPSDWLKTELVGLRFQPPGVHTSRFGLNVHDSTALMAAASIIRHCLPSTIKLGIHLHFAASAPSMSPEKWFGIAHATIEVAHQLSTLCQRNIDVVDFGGGFSADFINNPSNAEAMTTLCMTANRILRPAHESSNVHMSNQVPPLAIEFELGKCISEKSGALLCRVLEIRELWMNPPSLSGNEFQFVGHHTSWFDTIENEAQVEAMMSRLSCKRKAIIVDASVGEICCMHVHPIFWKSASIETDSAWLPFLPGNDEIWGRTCMEFDQLVGVRSSWGSVGGRCGTGVQCIAVPDNMQVGDFMVITCCGSYDMTMQYDFGDGVGRKHCTVIE